MRVRILFFGVLKDIVGGSAATLDLPDGSCAGDVLAHYEARIPQLNGPLSSLALAVNQEYASPGTKLKENDEIALLPPVSGGAPEMCGDGHGSPRPSQKYPRLAKAARRGAPQVLVAFEGSLP